MKKSFFGLIAIGFISLSSFTTKNSKELLMKECTYNMYNASGQYLGQQTISIFEDMSCGSSLAKRIAIDVYNG